MDHMCDRNNTRKSMWLFAVALLSILHAWPVRVY